MNTNKIICIKRTEERAENEMCRYGQFDNARDLAVFQAIQQLSRASHVYLASVTFGEKFKDEREKIIIEYTSETSSATMAELICNIFNIDMEEALTITDASFNEYDKATKMATRYGINDMYIGMNGAGAAISEKIAKVIKARMAKPDIKGYVAIVDSKDFFPCVKGLYPAAPIILAKDESTFTAITNWELGKDNKGKIKKGAVNPWKCLQVIEALSGVKRTDDCMAGSAITYKLEDLDKFVKAASDLYAKGVNLEGTIKLNLTDSDTDTAVVEGVEIPGYFNYASLFRKKGFVDLTDGEE